MQYKILIVFIGVLLVASNIHIQYVLAITPFTSSSSITDVNDNDGDSLPDLWEENGVDINNDGIIDLDLKKLGASPDHKDLFLEIDYMKDHKPIENATKDVIDAFANSSLFNPDNKNGINLHVYVDDEFDHIDSIDIIDEEKSIERQYTVYDFKDFYKIKSQLFGNSTEHSEQNENRENILAAKNKIFHYALFTHTSNDEKGLLGIAEDIPGKDFIVSLGGKKLQPGQNHTAGTRSDQSSTLMHEFGHTLGLWHGGSGPWSKGSDVIINDKPNYISVMNYIIADYLSPKNPLDYSRCSLDSINETLVDEPTGLSGIANNCPTGVQSVFYTTCMPWRGNIVGVEPEFITTGNPIDWNFIGGIETNKYPQNLNCDGIIDSNENIQFFDKLNSYDDWNNIVYNSTNRSFLEELEGESSSTSTNKTKNIDLNQNNITSLEYAKLKTFNDEPSWDDITLQNLGVLSKLQSYLQNDVNKTSFKNPTIDIEGNPIPSDAFADDVDPADAGLEYYDSIIGDPLADPTTTETEFADPVEDNTITNDIREGNVDAAIEKLDKSLLLSDSSLGGNPENDRIDNPVDQENLKQIITDLQNILKTQSCTYEECN